MIKHYRGIDIPFQYWICELVYNNNDDIGKNDLVGVVHDMKGTKDDDGDYQFNLALEQPYRKLLNQENYKQVKGMLVVEIIPKDQSSTLVQIPKNGDRIQAYGVWVTDNPHGWNELHPTWELKKLV